jgi:hypothetical protein
VSVFSLSNNTLISFCNEEVVTQFVYRSFSCSRFMAYSQNYLSNIEFIKIGSLLDGLRILKF